MKLPILRQSSLNISTIDGVLGGTIWPSASLLCQHIVNNFHKDIKVDNKHGTNEIDDDDNMSKLNVCELGSGTGVVGIYVAALGLFGSVHLTEHRPPMTAVIPSVPYNVDGTLDLDLFQDRNNKTEDLNTIPRSDRLLDLLEQNIQQNNDIVASASFEAFGGYDKNPSWPPFVHELDWSCEEHTDSLLETDGLSQGFDLILASDVTYMSELHVPLAFTIQKLLKQSSKSKDSLPIGNAKCFIAHQLRVLNLQAEDRQLESFSKALDAQNLYIHKIHETEVSNGKSSSLSSSSSPVSILEICHRNNIELSSQEDELWLPGRA